jgi:DtxR family transcriptional regulator, Mn-dependent transcriptional regulator
MSQKHELSSAEEEYLEAIYTKQESNARVATTHDLAACLSVRDASVTEMLKKLSEKGLVDYKPYRGATLTETGCAIATKVKRKHRVLERFLVDICGIDTRESHKQACEIEHVISDKAIDNLSAQLGHPSTCPGGSAIPESSSEDETPVSKLSDVGKGAYTIRFLTSKEPETISRLCSLGLIPGLTVRVLRSIAKGPLVIETKGTQIALGRDVAESLIVSPEGPEAEGRRRRRRRGAPSRATPG